MPTLSATFSEMLASCAYARPGTYFLAAPQPLARDSDSDDDADFDDDWLAHIESLECWARATMITLVGAATLNAFVQQNWDRSPA